MSKSPKVDVIKQIVDYTTLLWNNKLWLVKTGQVTHNIQHDTTTTTSIIIQKGPKKEE